MSPTIRPAQHPHGTPQGNQGIPFTFVFTGKQLRQLLAEAA